MKNRIRQVMEQAQMSQQDFATTLGISPASLSSIFTGRTNPTSNHVMAIHRALPQININWLMFGEGNMIEDSSSNGTANDTHDSVDNLAPSEEGAADGTPNVTPSDILRPQRPTDSRNAVDNRRNSASETPINPWAMRATPALPPRKIKEIRVFYDDGTYEAFSPALR